MHTKFSSKRPLTDEEEAEIQQMIASDPDNPELTDEQISNLRPFREVFPDLAASIDRELARRGRPPVENPRRQVSIRLDPDVLAHYKSTGKGWQSRINDALRKAAGL
ncbi:BrnA antitoxin family protein [Rhizobium sp. C4]|uniref:BrnA antitoxin family protein n=1 Tax=Rhizobium sp. C4 TaxID=1349800 RepID=UPI001E327CE1|nr:BrnA antitoxin family protein [Rhizobium sp. C4]MCD2174766.1 BrnA antitoxin family protein [Rhizobium sp. C4]